MKVPNLPKKTDNQSGWAREKPKDELNEIELSQVKSRLSNRYLWMNRYELFWQSYRYF